MADLSNPRARVEIAGVAALASRIDVTPSSVLSCFRQPQE